MAPFPLAQQLAQALGYWRDWLGPAGCRPLARTHLAEYASHSVILLAHPSLLPIARERRTRSSASGETILSPLPRVTDLAAWQEAEALARATDDSDQPRSLADRALELVEVMTKSSTLSALLHAPSQSGRLQLADEWVALFDRWDWLLAAWRQLKEPEARPVSLEGLDWLVRLYAALDQPDHAAAWFLSHPSQGSTPSNAPPTLIYWGFADALAFAQVLVVAGRTPVERLERPDLQHAALWQTIWPELQLLTADRWVPPTEWARLAERQARVQQLAFGSSLSWPPVIHWQKTKTMERGVSAAAQQLRDWLAEGRQHLAVVPADRRAARRLTATLAHSGFLVNDPSGWSMETTLAASALEGLFEVVGQGTRLQPVYNWLSHPLVGRAFAAAGLLDEAGLAAVFQNLRARSQAGQTGAAIRRVDCLPAPIREALLPLADSASQGPLALSDWLGRLLETVDRLGLHTVWAEDEAGLRLLSVLQGLRAECPSSGQRLSWAGFRAVLGRRLSPTRMPLRDDGASIHLMSVAEALLQGVDGVVILGAAEGQFPARAPSRLVSREQRQALEARADGPHDEALLLASLAGLLEAGTPVFVWAQAPESGLENLRWSSGLARLQRMLPASSATTPATPLASAAPADASGPSAEQGHQLPTLRALPRSLSVSALSHLARCPYRFFWQVVLGLAEWKPIDEAAGPAEFGSLLHRLVQAAPDGPRDPGSQALSVSSADWLGWLQARLASLGQAQPIGTAARLDLLARLPHLAEWLAEAAQTHALLATEAPIEGELLRSGVRLAGRLDWLDQARDGDGLRLIDFKTTGIDTMKGRLRQDQASLQLEAYAALLAREGRSVSEMGFVAVGRRSTDWLRASPPDGGGERGDEGALLEQADEALVRIRQGEALAPLEAAGSGRGCQHCPAKGACRAADWAADNGLGEGE